MFLMSFTELMSHAMYVKVMALGFIRIKDLRILPNSWKVYKGDKEIKLPNKEFELLKYLAVNPNIVFSKEQLFEKFGDLIT